VGWFSWGTFPHLVKKGGALEAIRKAQDEGLIQHVGFTGHDSPENFIKCIETGAFDCITIPYNLVNRSNEPLIKRAGELGIGVVAMCPVAGGLLSYESDKIKKELQMDLPTTELALRFVLSNPDVSTACSGMSTLEQLEQNVKTVKGFDPETDAQFEKMGKGMDRLRSVLGDKFCTSCRYCMPCAQEIDIPRYMSIYRNWKCFGLEEWARKELKLIPEGKRLADCTDCGDCKEKCPNDLNTREIWKELETLS
jgi:predicted aldo/keto reductase-like oxidoreductase